MFGAMNANVGVRLAAMVLVCCSASSCANLSFKRQTETSGTFTSTGMSFTILSVDIPKNALLIARENASDANMANLVVEETKVVPYLGPFDWLLDIIGVRYARVEGTWGFAGK
jgi:hypothetical protein